MRVSCLDIGSNTIKINVFEKKHNRWSTAKFMGEPTGLISYIEKNEDGRVLTDKGLDVLLSTLERLIAFSEENASERLFVFATASLRGVDNVEDVITAVKNRFGVTIDVLSGEEEALCSLRGLLCDERCEGISEGVMIDMGGGSSEIVYFKNGADPKIISLPFGCLSLTNQFVSDFPPKISECEMIRKHIKEHLIKCDYAKNLNCPVFLIGGTARAVGKLSLKLVPRNREVFIIADFEKIAQGMCKSDFVRDTAAELIPKRLYTITAGAAAYSQILEFISPSGVYISESGVREGYLERILV